ncbi:hypothetical protein CFC21_101280 [Triticum aestivum]|uniref:Uncharacterized protein n=2 Tax=Triticum aestivum TaxID=4565 RepID=A0A3B6SC58_WHEAT|nr:uncharacterized protein LOC119336283 [Triticum dicoccoides]XP_044429607.1 uncharacterized protein LOC123155509 [Triticum aestivum]KAF7099675.1 hypothetical protein CFC21_101280 [Triticum aestivum]
MGLPLEQWRSSEEADSGDGKQAEASGCRTPSGSKARAAADGGCPAPPRKRRAAPGAVSQQGGRGFYAGADVEAFFAANNL